MLKSQKKEFRQQVLKQEHRSIKQIRVAAQDLYTNVKGLEWKEHNKEVVIANIYHEVLSITKVGDHYMVNILEDKAENELFKKFFDHSDTSKGLTNYLQLVFAMNFTIPSSQEIKAPEGDQIQHTDQNKHKHSCNFYFKDIKPPRQGFLV